MGTLGILGTTGTMGAMGTLYALYMLYTKVSDCYRRSSWSWICQWKPFS